ncbi:MAG: hypothetical protein JST00_20560 [Deltaproteobacteria bacterium]|nr:hypothetical protein [Deltaproteobacteria bacterium]
MRTTFDAYLQARGFDQDDRSAFFRRMFVTPFAQPGFHLFWRLWNPFFGYGLFAVYVALGGKRRPLLASLLVFAACGFLLHDLLVLVTTRRLSLASTGAFVIFWALSVASRALAPRLRQAEWPRIANVALNVLCLAGGLVGGAWAAARLGI